MEFTYRKFDGDFPAGYVTMLKYHNKNPMPARKVIKSHEFGSVLTAAKGDESVVGEVWPG